MTKEEANKKEEITEQEAVETAKLTTQLFADKVKQTQAKRNIELNSVSKDFKNNVRADKKKAINQKYDKEIKEYSQNVSESNKKIIEYLNHKLDSVKRDDAVTPEAVAEIEILKQLDEITKEDMQKVLDKYQTNDMIVKLLSQIGRKHGLHFEPKTPENAKRMIDNLNENVKDFLRNYDASGTNYSHAMLLEEEGSAFEATIEYINDYIDNTIKIETL